MSTRLVRSNVPLLDEGQASQEVTHNEAMVRLSIFAGGPVLVDSITPSNTPPGSPVDEMSYLVDTAPTGAWASNASSIASWKGAWYFTPIIKGMLAYANDDDNVYKRTASAWTSIG